MAGGTPTEISIKFGLNWLCELGDKSNLNISLQNEKWLPGDYSLQFHHQIWGGGGIFSSITTSGPRLIIGEFILTHFALCQFKSKSTLPLVKISTKPWKNFMKLWTQNCHLEFPRMFMDTFI